MGNRSDTKAIQKRISLVLMVQVTICALFDMPSYAAPGALSCQDLLAGLRPHLHNVTPNLGEAFESNDPVPNKIAELLKLEGGHILLIGGGSTGSVFRWHRPDGTSLIVKHYPNESSSKEDAFKLDLMRSVSRDTDFVKVVAEARPPTPHLHFYQDVRGVNLGTLEANGTLKSEELMGQLKQAHESYWQELTLRLREKLGVEAVPLGQRGFGESIHLRGVFKRNLFLNPHKNNLVLDSDTGHLWVVDPE
jgi:hypothetical protein